MGDYVLGIDLGTTYSASALVKDGVPTIVESKDGYRTIPSIIAFDASGNLLVGHAAKRQFVINPLDTIYGSKRLVGLQFRPEKLEYLKKHFNYTIVQGKDNKYAVSVAGRVLSLAEVAAMILMEIKEAAQNMVEQRVTKAVISVPAYYNNNQRNAVKEAARLAEMEVVRIVNEPTAAALAYGFRKGLQRKIAVYDFGGGTFDVSILQVFDEVYEVIGTGGDSFLGGIDVDNRIVKWLVDKFITDHPEVKFDKVALQRIQDAAEKAKCDLASSDFTDINLPFVAITDNGPLNMNYKLDIHTFNKMIEDILDHTLGIVDRVLKQARTSPSEIEEIILVGGSTRIRLIRDKIEKFFGRPPRKGIHPDEAVAMGAAVLGDIVNTHGQDVLLVDVLPVSIGLGDSQGRFHTVVPRNTTVPNEITKSFITKNDLSNGLRLAVYQGESPVVTQNEKVGDYRFQIAVPPGMEKVAKKVKIYFELDADCVLTVRADKNAVPSG